MKDAITQAMYESAMGKAQVLYEKMEAEVERLRGALRFGIEAFNPGPRKGLHYGKAIHSRTCQAIDGHDCDCRVGQFLVRARAQFDPHEKCPPNAPCGMEASDGQSHGECVAALP